MPWVKPLGFFCDNRTNGLVTHGIKNSQHIVSSNLETVENLFGILPLKPDFTQMLGGDWCCIVMYRS